MDFSELTSKWSAAIIDYAPKIAAALLTLIIGLWIIKRIVNYVNKAIEKNAVDETLAKFLASLISAGLKIMLLFSVAGMFGVNTTSFIAIISALMIGVGMALNGTLSHVASGVMLMVFKPFKVGDVVEIGGGRSGSVESINAFNTTSFNFRQQAYLYR